MLAYRAYARWGDSIRDAGIGIIAIAILVAMIVAYPQIAGYHYDLGPGWGMVGYYVPQLFTALVLPAVFAVTRNSRVDALIGQLSYPVYLCHMAILQYVASLPPEFLRGLWRGELIAGLSLAAAIAFVLLLTPIERWRARLQRASAATQTQSSW
jgi:peptidoglycan/LPS O-acetylase OafA/YrhL